MALTPAPPVRRGRRRALWAAGGGLLLLLLLLLLGVTMARRYPRINDITTDVERPPVYWVQPPERGTYHAERFRAQTEAAYGDLKNLDLALPPDAAYARVLALVQARGWPIAARDDAGHRVQAVAVTLVLRFRDDVIVEVRPGPSPARSAIAMRSKSRIGTGDFGANAKRIRAFFADLKNG